MLMLHHAVSRTVDAAVVCETLVACGSEIEVTDAACLTPLMWAVLDNRPDIVRLLLALNADTTKTNWNVSLSDNAEILQLLSEHSKKTVTSIAATCRCDCLILFRHWNVNKRAWKRSLELDPNSVFA